MTNIMTNFKNRAVSGFKNHISKCAVNPKYDAKALLLATVGLNIYSNVVDYYRLKQNKEIEKEEKNYLQAFRVTNGIVSALAQTGVGLAIISDKAQNAIIKGISRFYKGFDKNLNNVGRRNLLKLTSLIGAVAITKRILTPLVVTPIASFADNMLNEIKEKEIGEEIQQKAKEFFNPAKNIQYNIFEKFDNDKDYDDDDDKDEKKIPFNSLTKKDFDYFKNNMENIFITNKTKTDD